VWVRRRIKVVLVVAPKLRCPLESGFLVLAPGRPPLTGGCWLTKDHNSGDSKDCQRPQYYRGSSGTSEIRSCLDLRPEGYVILFVTV
jgi:hypothetical protein